jgi:hypothetical protein
MKKFQVFLGLAVLVLVLWATTTPVNANSKSLIGSWVPSWDPVCCNTVTTGEYCEDWGWCWGGALVTCYAKAPWQQLNGYCHATGSWTCSGNYPCNDIHDAACNFN